MGRRVPVLVIVVAASIVLVAAVAAWYPQWAVAIVVRTERSDYLPGECVSFTLTLTVEGNRPVTASPSPGPRCGNVYYVVEDEAGRTIYPAVGGLGNCPLITVRLVEHGYEIYCRCMWIHG